jgi:molybdenum cofactor cytidylyltransferase
MTPAAAAIVLAAGLGTRFGEQPKLLAPLAGKPILQHVLDALEGAELKPIVVVLGHASQALRSSINWRDEIVIVNRHPERGQLRSVLLGLRRLDETWSRPRRTLIVLGDQPRLAAAQLRQLLSQPIDEARPFVVPRYAGGQPGNPVLLEAGGHFRVEQRLLAARVATDRGLGQFFATNPEQVRFVDVAGTNPDIDTPADLRALEASAGSDADR